VTRVIGPSAPAIDQTLAWGHAWHRDKKVIAVEHPAEVLAHLQSSDVALVYGSEVTVEENGLGYVDVQRSNPSIVYARCRPSRTSKGTAGDFGLLVEAQSGFYSQVAGHRPGPIFVDARASGSGTAFVMTATVLALLRRRELAGLGGWSETSLYDGMLATLGALIGRPERAAPDVESYWANGPTFPNFMYRCADGELIQVWFGGKGMYPKLLETLGDEPSTEGYYTDQRTGALNSRAERWKGMFATQPRVVWIDRLRAAGVACEPVLGPGQALRDQQLAASIIDSRSDAGTREVFVGTPIEVSPSAATTRSAAEAPRPAVPLGSGLLEGIRVLDFSAFVAGPLAAEVLADLGADVVKVEPPDGEAMRAAAYAIASCQRGKRSLALDIAAPESRPVVEKLIRWADVVLHNFRVGVSERLGMDEATVAVLNPKAVYCHASAFGSTGPRAGYPGNDALMQALTGLERAVGGSGNDPIAPKWIPIDMSGGWVAAIGILAGLLARARTGLGQTVATSLFGAGMLLQSGTFERDGELVGQPGLDSKQTGYGPGYRMYQGGDGQWFALVLPEGWAWERLRSLPGFSSLSPRYTPLRRGPDDEAAACAEAVLEEAFAEAPGDESVARLRGLGILAELIEEMSPDDFRRAILDDPVNRQLARVAAYATADWGWFEQIGPLLRCGPQVRSAPSSMWLPGIGEHTVDVLTDLGLDGKEIDALIEAKIARQL
jgi:crotonobetainyl-CoA:carnitine CoA-transferase CaiB-like acyl-CoA transferase